MASKSLLVALCFVGLSCANAQLQTVNGKVKITVGTTSGCGDTVNFITNQLVPTYAQYKDFLEVEFVPWGRTRRNADNSLTCQFGAADCFANGVHRCALHLLKGNQDAQVQYMGCEFSPPYPAYLQGSYACAQAAGLSVADLESCVATSGAALNAAAEEAAREPMTIINFVPTIHFNDAIDLTLWTAARFYLRNLICEALASDSSTGVTAASCW